MLVFKQTGCDCLQVYVLGIFSFWCYHFSYFGAVSKDFNHFLFFRPNERSLHSKNFIAFRLSSTLACFILKVDWSCRYVLFGCCIIVAFLQFHLRTVVVVSAFISSSSSCTGLSSNIIIWTPSHWRSTNWATFCSSLSNFFSSFYFRNDNRWLIFIVLVKIFSRLCNWWLLFSRSIFLISFHFFFMLFKLIHFLFFFSGSFGKLLLKLNWVKRLRWLFRYLHDLLRLLSLCHFGATLRSSHLYLRFLMNLF